MFQQVILVGNLGADPELKYTPTGVAVCNFSVAVNERWNDRQTGERKEKVTWFRVAAWRELGEHCATYLSKGRQVMVIGRVEEPSAWIGKDGQPRAQIEITARDVRFLGSRENGGAGAPSAPSGEGDEIPF
ncbi:MAG: hypothetical protein Kow00120_29900 [Anaerolineae bacterium]